MTSYEKIFFDRALRSGEFTLDDLNDISKAKIAVIGLGGVGSSVSFHLVKNGFGNLKIVDPDIVEYTDIYRSLTYSVSDTGYFKVEVVRNKLQSINPNIDVTIYPVMLTDFNVYRILRDADLVIDASDNIETKVLINRFSVREGVPVIYTAVRRNKGVLIFLEPNETACFECIHPDVDKRDYGVIDGYAVESIYSILASIVSHQATAYFLGIDPQLYGTRSIIKLDYLLDYHHVDKNPMCRVCSSIDIELPDIDYQHFHKGDTFIFTSDEKVRLDIERVARELAKTYILFRRGDVGVYFEYEPGVNVAVSYAGTIVVRGVRDFDSSINIVRRLVDDILYKYVID